MYLFTPRVKAMGLKQQHAGWFTTPRAMLHTSRHYRHFPFVQNHVRTVLVLNLNAPSVDKEQFIIVSMLMPMELALD
jgi:hypothetical protein